MIFGKRLPSDPDTSTGPADILEGDTLQMIVNKIQRWFNSLKWATGIGLSDDYAEATDNFNVNNNDSVETAISKLAGHVRALQQGSDNGTDNVIVSPGYDDAPTSDNGSGAGSVLTRLLEKLRYYSIKHETTEGIKLDSSYSIANRTITPGTSLLTRVLEKFGYDLNEIFSSAWRVPYYSILIYYRQPKYDNVIGSPNDSQKRIANNAGKSWFPCGYFFVGTSQECDEEQAKWDTLYGAGAISWSRGYNGSNYALKMTAYHGITIPDLSAKFLSGYDSLNPNGGYGTNQIGLTGGNNSHTLTTSEMPRHAHGKGTLEATGSINYVYPSTSEGTSGVFDVTSEWSTNVKGAGSDDNWGKHADFSLNSHMTGETSYVGGQDGATAGTADSFDIRPAFITVGYIIRLPS